MKIMSQKTDVAYTGEIIWNFDDVQKAYATRGYEARTLHIQVNRKSVRIKLGIVNISIYRPSQQ
jgi:hypothetical protein